MYCGLHVLPITPLLPSAEGTVFLVLSGEV
jgi:hypothetical protein